MNNRKKLIRRNSRIALAALFGLLIVAALIIPSLLAIPGGGGLLIAAAFPFGMVLRKPDDEGGGGGGGTLTEEQFRAKVLSGVDALHAHSKTASQEINTLKTVQNSLQSELNEIKKSRLNVSRSGPARRGEVTEDCARYLGSIGLLAGLRRGFISGDWAEGIVKDVLGIQARTALTSTQIPLPVGYSGEVVELVSQYSAARQYGTVFPLGAGTVNLPRLKTSPAFGLIAASGTVTEVQPATEWVTFSPEKFGGMVRLPTELDEDSIVAMGQFIARYSAREIAKVEDTNFFIGTGAGSGANGSVKGLCVSTIDNSKVVQMAGTKTKRSDTTLANLRSIRAAVDAAALANGAYYMHSSFEQHLSGLNASGDKPYQANGVMGATLDGFPIRWVDIMPVYSSSATVSTVHVLFGDLSYQYLGVRGGIRFDTSVEAGFTTDEILIRALERFTIGLMAVGAVAGLETAAS